MVLMTRHTQWAYAVPVFRLDRAHRGDHVAMLAGASWLERRLSKTFMNVVTRVMGLILRPASRWSSSSPASKDVLPALLGK